MRNRLVLLLLLLLLCLLVIPVATAQSFTTQSKYAILKGEVSPQPVQPGGDLFLKINFMDIKTEATDVVLRLDLKGPFTFKYPSERRVLIKQLRRLEVFEQDYHLTVDPTAKTGLYKLDLFVEDKLGLAAFKETMTIKVEGKPELIIINPNLSRDILVPGDDLTISFEIQNSGTGDARNVRALLNLQGISIIPLEDNSVFIENIPVGEKILVEFRLKVSKDTAITSYQIPIEVSAVDQTGLIPISFSEMVGIEIIGQSSLNLAGVTTDPVIVTVGDEISLFINVENTGEGAASSVSADVDLPFEGTKKVFMSEIKQDEEASALFSLRATQAGQHDYKLRIKYSDDFGEKTEEYDLELFVAQKPDMTVAFIIGGVIAALIVIFFIFSHLKKRKNET